MLATASTFSWMKATSALLTLAAVFLTGCQDQAYCFNCDADGSPNSSSNGGAAGSGNTGLDLGGKAGQGTNGTGIDLTPDACGDADTVGHCGECNNRCERSGAFASCEDGGDGYECAYECAPGRYDVDGDLYAPSSNGCEYTCVVTNGGNEICDGLDNDCNGEVDESTDTSDDPSNCGECGNVCFFSNAGAACQDGVCVATSCRDGFIDINGDLDLIGSDGCEYNCRPTTPPDEICDGIDNDCDGLIDSNDPDTDVQSNPAHCGACGQSCAGTVPNAVAACAAGSCIVGSCDPGFFDQNGDPADGCEAQCQSSCSFAFTSTSCDTDSCTFVECLPGHIDLDGDTAPPASLPASSPWEVPTGANGCEYACSPTNGGLEVCDGEDNDCDGLVDAADPDVDTSSDANHCGGCTTPSESFSCANAFAHSFSECQSGTCVLADCAVGYFDIDGNPSNGCEFSCSACQFPQATANAAYCAANGECQMANCLSGYLDLDGDPSNGCEAQCTPSNGGVEICDGKDNDCDGLVDSSDPDTNTATDPLNCGACGQSCGGQIPNAVPACLGGSCVIGNCIAGFYDENGDPSDGCEGNCASTCTYPFAITSCTATTCSFESCTPGYHDLDGDMTSNAGSPAEGANGCEYQCEITESGNEICDGVDNDCNGLTDEADPWVQISDDPYNCGACDNSCAALYPGAVPTCSSGSCILSACQTGYFNTDGDPDNGCEFNCNSCRFAHATSDDASCAATGICQFGACLDGYSDLDGDPDNGCEYQCAINNGGIEVCDGLDNDCDGLLDADDPDAQTDDDPLHCGGCTSAGDNHSCAGIFANSDPYCSAGTCDLGPCLDGYFDADSNTLNGCEFGCDQCSIPNAMVDAAQCAIDGECVFLSCVVGFSNLDADLSNGCEYQCSATNGGIELCDSVDNDCDGLIDEGVLATPENCGGCGFDCAAFFPGSVTLCEDLGSGPECVWDGCLENYADLDSIPQNGCEYVCTPSNGGVEACNGIDDDCDGVVDDVDPADLGDACAGEPEVEGECSGATVCADLGGGVYGAQCVRTAGPFTEVCDGLDNDCDGDIDETVDELGAPDPLPGTEIPCGSARGECTKGATACVDDGSGGKMIACSGGTAPVAESCDTLDNDCDGLVDEGLNAGPCFGGDYGLCQVTSSGAAVPAGLSQCVAGAMVCVGAVQPSPEVCDSFDNNCDGEIDEACWSSQAAFVRLDTGVVGQTASSQGQHSTYGLTATTIGDLFYVAYTDRRDNQTRIYRRVSLDAGTTWQPEARVSDLTNGVIAVEPNLFGRTGRLYTSYSRFSNSVRRIYIRASDVGSDSYGTINTAYPVDNVTVSANDAFGSRGIVARRDPVTSGTADYLAVVYTVVTDGQPNPARSVYFTYSKNGGTSWQGHTRLSASGNQGESPVLGTDGQGMVYVAWRERTSSGDRVGFRRIDLTVGSPSLETAFWISPLTTVNDLQMASDQSGNLHVVWTDVLSSPTIVRVASASACQLGNSRATCMASFSTVGPEINGVVVSVGAVAGSANNPSIAASGGAVAVAWEDARSGALDIRANSAVAFGGTWTWPSEQSRVDVGDPAGSKASLNPRVAFGSGGTVLVTWTDLRDAIAAIYSNISYDGGLSFYGGAGAQSLRIDSFTDANGAAADSRSPRIMPASTSASANVVWLDYYDDTTPATSGINGDVWTRSIGE